MGIPLRDVTRSPAHRPVITILIIAVNVVVFLGELAGGDAFVQRWSVIPAHIVSGHDWVTILTAMFMHGGWMHIIGNMVFFWAFGPEIEDSMGPFPYLAFYLLSRTGGVAGTDCGRFQFHRPESWRQRSHCRCDGGVPHHLSPR